MTFLIFHLFQLMRFADQFARQSGLAGNARAEFLSRLPLILHTLPHSLTMVLFMNNLFSLHQAVGVTLQPLALQRGTAE